MSPISFRTASASDEPVLWQAQYFAALLNQQDEPVAAVRADPRLACYVGGWGRDGDIGVVAESGDQPVGAAWCR